MRNNRDNDLRKGQQQSQNTVHLEGPKITISNDPLACRDRADEKHFGSQVTKQRQMLDQTGRLFEDNFKICVQSARDRAEEKQFWSQVSNHKQMLAETEKDLENEMRRYGAASSGSSGGSGSHCGDGGEGGDDGEGGYGELLKKILEMIRNIGKEVLKNWNDHKLAWKIILDSILMCLKYIFPQMVIPISLFEQNYEQIFDLLAKYFLENKNPTVTDIITFILRNVKGGSFEPIIKVYEGITERCGSKLTMDAIHLAINTFCLFYGYVLISRICEVVKGGREIKSEDESTATKKYDFLKGMILLIFAACKMMKEEKRTRCILL